MINIYEQIDANKRKSWVVVFVFSLIAALSIYFISLGFGAYIGVEGEIGGLGIAGIALIISGLISFGGYWFSGNLVLSLSGSRPADRKRDFIFFTVAENLSLASSSPVPKLYVIDDTAPNAFATGRDPRHAVICATTGLLSKLNRTELEGVIAHEISHIQNYDTRLMSVVTVLVGVITLLGDWFLRASWYGRGGRNRDDKGSGAIFIVIGMILALLSPIVAQLIQLVISRRREFLADASAVKLTRQPEGLLNALVKISADQEPLEAANKATAHLYIVNPFHLDISERGNAKGTKSAVGWFSGLFNTHPSIEDRLKQLRSMM